MNKITLLKIILPICLLMIFGAIFRFYNLDWGDPFYFHPDERNIASSISQLVFPLQLNPHFFAYGSFPIYLIFIIGLFVNFFHQPEVSFQQAIVISRIFSASLSLLLIPSLFYIAKKITHRNSIGMLAAVFATTSTGLIQFAHFGTFEMWLTFIGFWLFYFCVEIAKTGKFSFVLLSSLCSGLLMATKVSSLLLIPLPILCIIYYFWFKKRQFSLESLFQIFLYSLIVLLIYVLTNPFVFLDTKSFLDSMHYETQVAMGSLPVFYTGEFFTAVPVFFQLLHVFPFLLNPFITVASIFAFLFFFYTTIRTKKIENMLLIVFFIILFFSQAILFVKWTRYMMPTLPFIYLFLAMCVFDIFKKRILHNVTAILCIVFLTLVSFFYGTLFTYVAYVRQDTRLAAVDFAKNAIPSVSPIITEVYDLGIVPFNSSFPHISLFNFYDLDNNGAVTNSQLTAALSVSDYIILPSQRILKPRIINSKMFPFGNIFYTNLFNGSLGFKKIYETPCDILCKIVYINDPVFALEETATVFDRPTLYIFKKE